MNLASRELHHNTWPSKSFNNEYMLVMTPEEYEQVLKGKVLTHLTGCFSLSGTWKVCFRKNSKKKHKEFYG